LFQTLPFIRAFIRAIRDEKKLSFIRDFIRAIRGKKTTFNSCLYSAIRGKKNIHLQSFFIQFYFQNN
jgi:hypothetical protein